MRIDDKLRKAIVAIGYGGQGNFITYGTGFITTVRVDGSTGFQQIVTAKHVIQDFRGDDIHIRVNRLDGRAQIVETKKDEWVNHPDSNVDLCVLPSRLPREQFDIMYFDVDSPLLYRPDSCGASPPMGEGANALPIGIGDEVCIPGMFILHPGQDKNIPIIRTGTIARMPEEKLRTLYGEHDAYLVEIRSVDGLSGSPVFALSSTVRIQSEKIEKVSGVNFYLIGVLLGHHQVRNQQEVVTDDQGNDETNRGIYIPQNTGIGVVIPIGHVLEIINHPQMIEQREAALEGYRRNSSFVPDSASHMSGVTVSDESARSASDATPPDAAPDHRGSFNSLVSAAAKRKPSDDRT